MCEQYCCDLAGNVLKPQDAIFVVFGATGDLAKRKIFPALYNLDKTGLLPPLLTIVGFARRSLDAVAFGELVRSSCAAFSHTQPLDEQVWARFAARLSYVQGSFDESAAYEELARRFAAPGVSANGLFYLATAPEEFAVVAQHLAAAGLASASCALDGSAGAGQAAPLLAALGGQTAGPAGVVGQTSQWGQSVGSGGSAAFRRLIVEKPFGKNLASSRRLSAQLRNYFAEDEIYRIDHYLGKETVQNLLYFRFANAIFEPLWNRQHIESVEIDVLETVGVGERGGYYDTAGAARDMIQNHLVQLLCLVAMESPASLESEAVRDEKVKVLKSIRTYSADEFLARSVRGQYGAGFDTKGKPVAAYTAEPKVAPASRTETFAALRLEVDNWRWAGVPFTLRTGKALDKQQSEIRVNFHRPPGTLYAAWCGEKLAANRLSLRIQPDGGLWLRFNAKEPGSSRVSARELRFSYQEKEGAYFPEAYERLIADALAGDATLFIRADEAQESWRIIDGLLAAWAADNEAGGRPQAYAAGSSGPVLPFAGAPSLAPVTSDCAPLLAAPGRPGAKL